MLYVLLNQFVVLSSIAIDSEIGVPDALRCQDRLA